jgi:hypothetical protein
MREFVSKLVAICFGCLLVHSNVSVAKVPKGKVAERNFVRVKMPDNNFLTFTMNDEEFARDLGQFVTEKSKQNVTYTRVNKAKGCDVTFASSVKSSEWPDEICLKNHTIKKFKLGAKTIEDTANIFIVLGQIYAELPGTKKIQEEKLKGTEIEKVIGKPTRSPDTDFFGVAIVQPAGGMLEFGMMDLCWRLARTHKDFRWYPGPSETQFYLVVRTLIGETLMMLFEANKVNIGTLEKPEFALTNQIIQGWLLDKKVSGNDLLKQFKALEGLKRTDEDLCPGVLGKGP